MIASLKNKESGVRVLTLSFTGTVEEAYAAQRKSREVEENSPDAPNDTRIRDWTGSGEENNPQAKKNQVGPQGCRSSGKKLATKCILSDCLVLLTWP